MVRLCNGAELPKGDRNKVYLLRSFGTSAHEMWDVTNPEKPAIITVIVQGFARHAQELVGVRYGHRVPGLRRERLEDRAA